MSSLLPKFSYIGLDVQGNLALFVSQTELSICGPRLLQNNRFPASVHDFYTEPFSQDACKAALRGLAAFLAGTEATAPTLTFGQTPAKPKRKRTP